jgi:ABC-type nitrate/sulfonate/bicarbonate transport system permease component
MARRSSASGDRTGFGALLRKLPPLRGLLPLVLFLAGWEILGPAQSPYFPPPSTWWTSVVELGQRGRLLPAIGATLLSFVYGLTTAALVGGGIGMLIGVSRIARRALGPLLEFCRALPPPVVVPVAILLLGYGQNLKLLVVAWAAIWPILLNTASATSLIDPLLVDVGRTFRLGTSTRVRKIIAPAAVPGFLLGVRVAVPLAIIITLLVEMLTLVPGIGSLIVRAQREYQSAQVYGLLVLVGMLGFLLNNGFALVEGFILRHRPPRAHESM